MRNYCCVGIIRHNTSLGGDLRLAIREMEKLAGKSAAVIRGRQELDSALHGNSISGIPELRSDDDVVALSWDALDLESINRLLRCSAFIQELIFPMEIQAGSENPFNGLVAPVENFGRLDGEVSIALGWGYILESEGVLKSAQLDGRVRHTIDLLFEPYKLTKASPASRRLRKAKKTTLSLSHDLHIYKAKFFPRMVRALINIFGKQAARIVDPFCGSGTALLEASLLGFDSVGIDVDPICQMIARAKVNPFLNREATLAALDCFDAALGEEIEVPSDFSLPEELHRKIERRDRLNDTSYLSEITSEAAKLAAVLQKMSSSGCDLELLRVIASDAVTKKIRYRYVGVGNGRYTIEILKQSLLDRAREKSLRARQLCFVFEELQGAYGFSIGAVDVHNGDARIFDSWGLSEKADLIITSPPYLPASSGREHYSASRALSFAILGINHGDVGYYNVDGRHTHSEFDLTDYVESDNLVNYLLSDYSSDADPQRGAMRFKYKAMPTREYLEDMQTFFGEAQSALSDAGKLLLVVANQHTFYSHRRQAIEYIVDGPALYGELAASRSLRAAEVVKMELLKSTVSKARPRATDDYFEAVIVMEPVSVEVAKTEFAVTEKPEEEVP